MHGKHQFFFVSSFKIDGSVTTLFTPLGSPARYITSSSLVRFEYFSPPTQQQRNTSPSDPVPGKGSTQHTAAAAAAAAKKKAEAYYAYIWNACVLPPFRPATPPGTSNQPHPAGEPCTTRQVRHLSSHRRGNISEQNAVPILFCMRVLTSTVRELLLIRSIRCVRSMASGTHQPVHPPDCPSSHQ